MQQRRPSNFDLAPYRRLYPFESHYASLSGLRCHYLDEGRGETLVLIHGNPTWSFYFRNLITALRDSYRLIAPDHIGCGLSEKPGQDRYSYRLQSRIDDLEDLLGQLEIKTDITLVVHDWGGPIGLGYAGRHLQSIKRLIIFNTGAFLPKGKQLPWQLRAVRDTKLAAILVRAFNAFSLAATVIGSSNGLAPDVKRAYRAPYNSWRNRIATLRFVQDIPLKPQDPSFAHLDLLDNTLKQLGHVPALICWGERDFVFDRHFLNRWRTYLPQAEVHAFADAGHLVMEDAAAEIIPIVRRFLEKHPPRSKS